jgi:hypothetical protein
MSPYVIINVGGFMKELEDKIKEEDRKKAELEKQKREEDEKNLKESEEKKKEELEDKIKEEDRKKAEDEKDLKKVEEKKLEKKKKEEDVPKEARELIAETNSYILDNKNVVKEIANGDEYKAANLVYKEVKFRSKMLDTERKKATKKLDDLKFIIMGWFQPSQDELAIMEKLLKVHIRKYEEGNERKRREEIELAKRKAQSEEEKKKKELEEKIKEEDRKKSELEKQKREEERKLIIV